MIYFFSFIIVLGIPVFLHELGHFLAAKSVGIKVEKFYVGFDFFNLGIKKKYKGTEYGIGLFPLGGYVKVAGIIDENMETQSSGKDYEFRSKNVFQKIWFLSAGVIMNFVLAIFVFSCVTLYEGYPEIVDEPIINEVHEEFPASVVGLEKDDKILAINKITIKTFSDLQQIVKNNFDNEISLEWEREGKIYSSTIIPVKSNKFEKGEIVDIGIIGVTPYVNMIEVGVFKSISIGLEQTINWIEYISYSIWALITGNVALDQLAGPLQIAKIAGDTANSGGFYSLILLMAIISINLGLINILPLPVVDGGHVVIAIIEGIYGKELPLKIKYSIQVFGTILLMSLFIFIFINDLKSLM